MVSRLHFILALCTSLFALTACSSVALPERVAMSQFAAPAERNPAGVSYQQLFAFPSGNFGNCPDGAVPQGALTAVDGILYGTTNVGGAYGAGTLFALRTSGKQQVRFSFNPASTSPHNPAVGVVDVHGTLYGTTSTGGTYGLGTVYAIGIASRNAGVLHSFGAPNDGATPAAALIAARGMLFGTTTAGGADEQGTVFSISLTTGKERILHSFGVNRKDGQAPYASLLFHNGKLYGTTSAGGASGVGTIFKVDPATGDERTLYSFSHYFDGQYPQAPLIAVGGKLYGTTLQGGSYASSNGGTLFRIDPSGNNEKILHSFGGGSDGQRPYSPVVQIGGKLYGTTSSGGANTAGCPYDCGTVYRFNLASHREAVLHSFGAPLDGAFPIAGLLNLNGTLYGTTALGGTYGDCLMSAETGNGTVFTLTP